MTGADARGVLQQWSDEHRMLHAVVLQPGDVQSCSGAIARVDEMTASIVGTGSELRLPYGTAVACEIDTADGKPKSLILSWDAGKRVFVTCR